MSMNVMSNERLSATSVTNVTATGEKVIRHITRDVREPDIVAQGNNKELPFADVFKCITAAIRDEKIKVSSFCYFYSNYL
jgi:hypothetical protein